ncbi:1-deoxy-D-xylulose-5-phosphate reductoisomerase [Candidatus Sumerlaeota bacterium]|nr:1-deoxy-D-xylulose-5-phosphate reductoisomerase [Candidatus Sumerlaeota bacterium]
MAFQSLTLLGSTGSIGRQTLDVLRHLKGRIRLAGISAGGRDLELLAQQVVEFQPEMVHIGDESRLGELRARVMTHWSGPMFAGAEGLARIAAEAPADVVLIATVGWAGLPPAMAAIEAGRAIALANKEALVCGGTLLTGAARTRNVPILPVDSEHSAIFQCLHSSPRNEIRKLILTCSGGPFLNSTKEQIDVADADVTLRHPRWKMGNKVTIDSATLMNKGFEVIEAHHLFGIPYDNIEVVIHPQSVVHSLVEFVDGSVLAQLGPTDMRLPIQYALTYPERFPSQIEALNLGKMGSLTFDDPDHGRFPALSLAYAAGRAGGTAPCVLNAANEVAVQLHMEGRIACGAIPRILRGVMEQHRHEQAPSLEKLQTWDRWGRDAAANIAAAL